MLSKFHKNLIIFFCVLLIVISIIFYKNFMHLLSNNSYPKYINPCPDHWNKTDEIDHKCVVNRLNKGTGGTSIINLTKKTGGKNDLTKDPGIKTKLDDVFEFKNVYNKNNYCALYEYSKKNNIQWSGITNANYTKYC